MIEPITQDEFAKAQVYSRGTPLSPEMAAIRALKPGTGIKMPCRWKHSNEGRSCLGGIAANREARVHGGRVRTHCKDKILYVWRVK